MSQSTSQGVAESEAGPDPDHARMRAFLREMIARHASDLHMTVGERPRLRIDGDLTDVDGAQPLLPGEVERLAFSLLKDHQRDRFMEEDELDFSFGLPHLARFRGNLFRQRGSVALAIRQIPFEIRPVEELGLPPIVSRLAERPRGLVLVTGPTGSGKTTTLAALVDRINRSRACHIITIEDPIEFIHRHAKGMVNQREVGSDTRSFASALKYALRQDPDVILIGELRDVETMSAALGIAETGHLVFATLHTNSAGEAVNRIIDAFPAHQQDGVRTQLSFVLEGVVTQMLIPSARGKGRVCAAEVMICTPAIRAVIRDEKVHQIPSLMQAGRKHGMQTMNESLQMLYLRGEITLDDAVRRSSDPNELLRALGQPPLAT